MKKLTRKPVGRLRVVAENRMTEWLTASTPHVRTADGHLKTKMILEIIQNPQTMSITDPDGSKDEITVPGGLVEEILGSYIWKTRRLKARNKRIASLEERCRSLEQDLAASEAKRCALEEENKALKAGNADLSEKISSIRIEGAQKATKARAINSARARDALDRVVQAPGLFD